MQLRLFDNPNNELPAGNGKIAAEALFEAYFTCRKNKRNTYNALAFELDYEHNLIELLNKINNHEYKPRRSIAFIVDKPVKREIFAADFRDRVVHHLIINKLNPLFEREFIYDNYSCRVGKGTHFGIGRADTFIRKCSENYKSDCYILKLDIQGFFMHINRQILFDRLQQFIRNKYQENDILLLTELCKIVIFNDPTKNCIIKGRKKDWEGLLDNKSLFHSPASCGLPIGNLTSQIFANFYMNSLDHFVKSKLGIRYYGRYVDDFILVHKDKDYLTSLITVIAEFLQSDLQLTLHPKKILLQHYNKGLQFLGAVIKPGRIYVANRTKSNFYTAIQNQNTIVRSGKPDKSQQAHFLCSMNSYLGILNHYKTYRLRKKMLISLSAWWLNYAYISGGIAKFVLKRKPVKKAWFKYYMN